MRLDAYKMKKFQAMYDECESDSEFYIRLINEEGIFYDDDIKEIMGRVTGSDDAYFNALSEGC